MKNYIDVNYFSNNMESGSFWVIILGWNIKLFHKCVKWLVRKALNLNLNILVIELPTEISNFKGCLSQIKERTDEIRRLYGHEKIDLLIGFSMGALFAAHIEAEKRIFISPYWRIPKNRLIMGSYLISRVIITLLSFIRIPILSKGFSDKDMGEIDVPEDTDKRISFHTIGEVMKAQEGVPEFHPSDRLLLCPDDKISGLFITPTKEQIKNIDEFFGGHNFMCVEDRDKIFEDLVKISEEKK